MTIKNVVQAPARVFSHVLTPFSMKDRLIVSIMGLRAIQVRSYHDDRNTLTRVENPDLEEAFRQKYHRYTPLYNSKDAKQNARRMGSFATLKYTTAFGDHPSDAPDTWDLGSKEQACVQLEESKASWPPEIQKWWSQVRVHGSGRIKHLVNRIMSVDGPIPASLLKHKYSMPPCGPIITHELDATATIELEPRNEIRLKHSRYYRLTRQSLSSHPNIIHLDKEIDNDKWFKVAATKAYDHFSYNLELALRAHDPLYRHNSIVMAPFVWRGLHSKLSNTKYLYSILKDLEMVQAKMVDVKPLKRLALQYEMERLKMKLAYYLLQKAKTRQTTHGAPKDLSLDAAVDSAKAEFRDYGYGEANPEWDWNSLREEWDDLTPALDKRITVIPQKHETI